MRGICGENMAGVFFEEGMRKKVSEWKFVCREGSQVPRPLIARRFGSCPNPSAGDSVAINVCKTEPEAERFKIGEERLHSRHVDSLRSMHSPALRRFLCLLGVPSVLGRPEDNSSL